MSFNELHSITRFNYEEAFLLYTDGELSAEGMAAVEAFAALHPDLQLELDLLLDTRLSSETILFADKESLLAPHMKAEMTDEDLLLYLDDELPETARAHVESKWLHDKDYHQQYRLLQSVKLVADKTVVYPNKSELYRQSGQRIQPILWRIAAAVILLLGIGLLWTSLGKNDTTDVAAVQKQPDKTSEITTLPSPSTPEEKPMPSLALHAPEVQKVEKQNNNKRLPKSGTSVAMPAPDPQDRVLAFNEPRAEQNNVPSLSRTENTAGQQMINNNTVTTGVQPAYTTIEGSANTETSVTPAFASSNDKKGSVRGFIRKASRLIERSTGINPVNEDDELLIGVVALKLK